MCGYATVQVYIAKRLTGSDGQIREFKTSSLSTTAVPQASSQYRVVDDGNCSPRFMRLTVNQIPNTKELAKRLAIPIAIVMQVCCVLQCVLQCVLRSV